MAVCGTQSIPSREGTGKLAGSAVPVYAPPRPERAGILVCTSSPSSAKEDDKQSALPVCDKKIGSLSVKEPENNWWHAYNLESPEALIKVFVAESKCFTIVDRGKGLAAAQQERALSSGGEMRVGANVGGLLGGALGGVLGGVCLKSKTADVVLSLTDVRSTEVVATVKGHAKKTNLGWGAGAGGYFGAFAAAGASSYSNTEIGQVVAMAYLDAYKKLIAELQTNTPDAKADNVSQAVTMAKPGKLYAKPDLKSEVVRDLDAGMMLYPTGEKSGPWWKVSDELGNEGWVPSGLLALAK